MNILHTVHANDQPRHNVTNAEPSRKHIIQFGDTGNSIAGQYGIPFERLCGLNPGIVWKNLIPGDSLNLSRTTHDNDQPRPNLETYTVKDGDTGIKIARENGITFQKLCELNPGIVWGKLMSGDSLNIPNNQS